MRPSVSRRVPLFVAFAVGAALLAGARTAGAVPAIPEVPLVVVADEGIAAVSLKANTTSGTRSAFRPTRRDEVRVVPKLQSLLNSVVRMQGATTFSSSRRTQRRLREAGSFVSRLFRRILDRQINPSRRHAPTAGGNLSALGLASVVTAAGFTMEEDVSVTLTLNGQSYQASLTQEYKRNTENGASLVVDYSALPAPGAVDGTLFAAFIRESSAPTIGLLVMGVFDDGLPDLVDDYGLTNETVTAKAVNVPYVLALTGAVRGTLTADDPSVDDVYFARENVLGIAVPEALAEQVAVLVQRLSNGVP